VQFKRPYFAISIQEKIKLSDAFFRLAFQKIIYGIIAAGMGLIFIKELVFAFGACPHLGKWFVYTNLLLIAAVF